AWARCGGRGGWRRHSRAAAACRLRGRRQGSPPPPPATTIRPARPGAGWPRPPRLCLRLSWARGEVPVGIPGAAAAPPPRSWPRPARSPRRSARSRSTTPSSPGCGSSCPCSRSPHSRCWCRWHRRRRRSLLLPSR
ncbi:unnamed protein product, partial [Ectocarpus sp. 8 AP-2014]